MPILSILVAITPFLAEPPDETRIVRRDPGSRPTYRLTQADEELLDKVQYACFLYFWKEVGQPSGLVKDRLKAPVSSIAAVGFQLSSLPIGVERRWITRDEGRQRAETILRSLIERDDNKKFGVYLHFPDLNTGGMSHEGYEMVASTVDHALLLAGAMTVAQYFRGETAALADRMVRETNWDAFAAPPNGFLSMGWRLEDPKRIDGPGRFVKWQWTNASDEERLIYFLGAGSPVSEFALDPALYYKLKRVIKQHEDMEPFVVSWPGGMFTYFFSHCWIYYSVLGPDRPERFDIQAPSVDWWENSRRAVLTHRQRCIEAAGRFRTFGPDRWGLSACVGRDGYLVPGIKPNIRNEDHWGEGTIAPYAAASSIMFAPPESLAAMRAFLELKDRSGKPRVWNDPAEGGYGFADAFNLDQNYVSDDYVGIDQGPMLLAIENARTGLIWKLFMSHPVARTAVERLELNP